MLLKRTMKKLLLLVIFFAAVVTAFAQDTLPALTVKSIGKKIIVSWRNEYVKPVSAITIQRSYDSLRNYTSIGSVLNPQNKENGFADDNAPYNKMYYRVLISFEGGAFVFTPTYRPIKEDPIISVKTADGRDSLISNPVDVYTVVEDTVMLPPPPVIGIPAQSQRLFAARDNSIILSLPDAKTKKYVVKFFDEEDRQIFEINKIADDFLIIEKVNFVRSGNYHFEIYENGILLEKNKVVVPKDVKKK